VDLVRLVPQSDSILMRNVKRAERLFIPDVVAIATDSRLLNLALTLALGVSSGYKITNEFLTLFLLLQILPLKALLQTYLHQSPFCARFPFSHIFLYV